MKKTLLSLVLGALISVPMTMSAQTVFDSFTINPAPGELSYTYMKGGLQNITFSPKSGVTPSANAECTENIELYYNDELLLSLAPTAWSANLVPTAHGQFWNCGILLNPGYANDADMYKQEGTYRVEVPGNLVMVNDEGMPAFTLEYSYAAPQEGDIDFSSYISTAYGENFYSVYIKMDDTALDMSTTDDFKCDLLLEGELVTTLTKDNTSAWGGNNYTINIPDDIRMEAAPGIYTFKVYPNSLKAVDAAKNIYGYNAEELEYEYQLYPKFAIVANPELGSTVSELSEIILTTNRLVNTTTPWDSTMRMNVQKDGATLSEYTVSIATVEGAYEGSDLRLTIEPAITEAGEYSITNVQNFFNFKLRKEDAYSNGYYNVLDIKYTVQPVSVFDYFTINPAPGELSYTYMKGGLQNITFSPKSDVTPSANAECTENIELYYNDELLLSLAPTAWSANLVPTAHGQFWNCGILLNPGYANDADMYKQEGTYRVEVPGNLVMVNDEGMPAFTLEYSYAAPQEGDIDFSSYISTAYGENFYSVYIKMDDTALDMSTTDDFKCDLLLEGELVTTLTKDNTSAWGGNNYTINIPDDIRMEAAPGIYTFKVYPNSLKAVDAAKNIYGYNAEELEYEYQLYPKFAIVANPELGSTVSELSEIILTTNRLVNTTTPWDSTMRMNVQKDGETLSEYTVSIATVEGAYEGSDLRLTIEPAITEAGEYSITNVQNFFNFKLRKEDAYSNSYYNVLDIKYTVDPTFVPELPALEQPEALPAVTGEVESDELNVITLTFAEDVEIESVDASKIGLYNNDVEFVSYTAAVEGNVVVLTNDENGRGINEFGIYTLVIPAEAIVATDGRTNDAEWQFSWNVSKLSGISSILNATEFTVYNVQGVRVLNNAGRSALDTLEPGIYVINGQKVIIRR